MFSEYSLHERASLLLFPQSSHGVIHFLTISCDFPCPDKQRCRLLVDLLVGVPGQRSHGLLSEAYPLPVGIRQENQKRVQLPRQGCPQEFPSRAGSPANRSRSSEPKSELVAPGMGSRIRRVGTTISDDTLPVIILLPSQCAGKRAIHQIMPADQHPGGHDDSRPGQRVLPHPHRHIGRTSQGHNHADHQDALLNSHVLPRPTVSRSIHVTRKSPNRTGVTFLLETLVVHRHDGIHQAAVE